MATKEQKSRWSARYYAANRETILAKGRATYHANRDKEIQRSRAYHKANPDKARTRSRRRYYGLDPAIYEQFLKSQNGLCAICQNPPRPGKILDVDHDHESGMVRGLLCHGCNWSLGVLGDNLEGIWRAVDYLRRARAMGAIAA
jgi:hypothetical protein